MPEPNEDFYWGFFWQTELSPERQKEIVHWLSTLTEDQIKLLEDLVQDQRNDAEWNCEYAHSMDD